MLNLTVDMVGQCWNCVEKGHRADKCKKPKDPVTYNKNQKAFKEGKIKSSGGGSDSNKSDKNSPEYQRKQWEANACNMVDGVLYINCKTCGLNTSHETRQHDAYVTNSSSFKLASTHFYVKECTHLAQGYTGVMKTAPGMVPPPPTEPGPAHATGLNTLTI